jgi:2-amino-4-hydroxy-6-hydroxymethyldihydropteridine diphosphokinase
VNRVFVLLGSNIEKERHLPAAVALLRPHGLVRVSPAYETAPVGAAGAEPFLNAAAELATGLGPEAFKREVCAGVERDLGRVRDPRDRYAPRTIDVDIALWNDEILTILGAPVPDPDILRFLHAARPLADLAPGRRYPGDGRTLARIVRDLEELAGPANCPRERRDVMLQVHEPFEGADGSPAAGR